MNIGKVSIDLYLIRVTFLTFFSLTSLRPKGHRDLYRQSL